MTTFPSIDQLFPGLDAHELLLTWVIYGPDTKDHPGDFVVRPHAAVNGRSVPSMTCGLAPTLRAARAMLPWGLANLGRYAGDDPVIVEVWI